jgi:hypothetical protein
MRLLRILALVAFVLAFMPAPAVAVTGFDSAYSGESAFVTIRQGESASFQVFFMNTGTVAWTKGSDTQVDLAQCLADKVTCNAQDPGDATWNNGWMSLSRYATHTQAIVSTGSLATFAYNIRAPSDATGTHRFNGDLVLAKTGDRIHPEGYYQDATIDATGSVAVPTPTPTPGSTPFPSPPPPTATPTPTPTPTPNVLRAEPGVFCDGVSSSGPTCSTPANDAGPFGPALASTVGAEWHSVDGNEFLILSKECTGESETQTCLAANSSAGAEITLNGAHFTAPITELAFDVRDETYCGAGAPRFNVYTSADFSTVQFFGCAGGTHTDLDNGWSRVTFGPVAGPVFALEIIQDEPGSTTLDNFNVNGIVITNSSGTTIP